MEIIENILYKMQPVVTRYCDVVAQITKTAVAVLDGQGVYMLYKGGKWRTTVGDKYERAGLAGMALKTGEVQVLLEPQGHPVCKSCKFRNNCKDIAEIWAPIILFNQPIGVIGFICETVQQQSQFQKNSQTYTDFLKQIANLIALEAAQLLEAEKNDQVIALLEMIIERLDSGVMVLTRDNGIAKINKMAKKILNDTIVDFKEDLIAVKDTGERIDSFNEYIVSNDGVSQTVVGHLYEMNAGAYAKVLLFNSKDYFNRQHQRRSSYTMISGSSSEINAIKKLLIAAANTPSNILINAEDGLGKELFAKAIHDESDRKEKPFVVIDCETLPTQDVEQYLFGTANASMSAGSRGKAGIIESAEGGTLFFDNFSKLPMILQQKLLPFFEKKEVYRVGSKRGKKINARIIAATSDNLKELYEAGSFTKSLYYLMDVFPISIPPLRQRKEDIRPMAIDFISYYSKEMSKNISVISEDFWKVVESYDWPGNARELQSAIEYVVNRVDISGSIDSNLLPSRIKLQREAPQQALPINLETAEKMVIRQAIKYGDVNGLSRSEVAELLGIGEATLYRKIKKYLIDC